MDFNMKQWRNESEEDDQQTPSPKLPILLLNNSQQQSASSALPFFVSNLSAPHSSDHSTTKFPRMESYLSLSQRQELELQALIFRHMIAGSDIPPQLLHLVKKSLINSPLSPYLQYYPHYQPPLVQSGYWGRGAMDAELGRCRRTDGKKWRCSRDVVAGQKYCERHIHRGRNRSRKPVECPTSAGGNPGGEAVKTNHFVTRLTVGGGGGSLHSSHSTDLHINQRSHHSIIDTDDGRTLRHFFDDWPKPLHETENAVASVTNLSISMPGNSSSDFSLKLGTGNGDEPNTVAHMGGPLAEALRSSTSNSSPTSVLHRLPRAPASEAGYLC